MVSFNTAAIFSLVTIGSLAAPAPKQIAERSGCMSYEEADVVATKYGELIATYTDELAQAILTESFTDFSESVNTLINTCPQGDAAIALPLLAPTFSSRQQFMKGQAQQPQINFKRLQMWNTCSSVLLRWETTNTANITDVKPVIGIIALEVQQAPAGNPYPWVIDRCYSEFDSGAWLQNLQAAGICAQAGGPPAHPAPGSPAPGSPAPGPPQPLTGPAPVNPTQTAMDVVVGTGSPVVGEYPSS